MEAARTALQVINAYEITRKDFRALNEQEAKLLKACVNLDRESLQLWGVILQVERATAHCRSTTGNPGPASTREAAESVYNAAINRIAADKKKFGTSRIPDEARISAK